MNGTANVILLIPAYRPGDILLSLIREFAGDDYRGIVIVDDGSGPEYAKLFSALRTLPRVSVLRHALNMGKGAALKTGMNYVLCEFPEAAGIVTADADGQHCANDIRRVAEKLASKPDSVVLGVRQFHSTSVPLRSRIGNKLSVVAVRWLIGKKLSDTQTGLRGLPLSVLPHLLGMKSSGYEFELDMLIACKHHAYDIVEEPIATIYEEGNRSSHFNPLLDSLRIYFVLLRFGFVSLLTSIIDNIVFILAFPAFGSVAKAQILARAVAVAFNYVAARRAVFLSREQHLVTFPRYLLLVLASGTVSYGLIELLLQHTALSPIVAKIAAEAMLFIANFAVQRDFVFRKRKAEPAATDWDRYYREVPATARLTRRYTEHVIASALRKYCGAAESRPVLVELGGANSCFLDRIMKEFEPREYHVIDTNQHGLDLLDQRFGATRKEVLHHNEDCLAIKTQLQADIAFSVGLIEHFTPADTKKAILAHFDLLRPGGWVLISFPTPTLLYRVARSVVSAAGLWRFPDERPLQREEVISTVRERGQILYETVLWPLVFTQHLVLARKNADS